MGLGPKLSTAAQPRPGEPQAHRFELIKVEQVGLNVVALVRYPDASEFDGAKVLLYRNEAVARIEAAPMLDPHFLMASAHPKPFARFEPTEEGLRAALLMAEAL